MVSGWGKQGQTPLRCRSTRGTGTMLRTLSLALLSLMVWSATAQACEKHLDGHQSSSDTSSEAQNR